MIDYSKYEKISDNIMIIANKVILKMNVGLAYYNSETNRRNSYHREVEFYSQKANKSVINIKRNFDYYLSIEHMVTKDYVRISVHDILKLRFALNEAYKYFTDPKYNNLYAKSNGELIMLYHPEPIIITGLAMDRFLQFEPCVFTNFRGEAERGIRMSLSSSISCDIPINRLEGFKYIIDTINIFECAQNMINYMERPPFGTNLYSLDTETDIEEEEKFQGKENRTISSRRSNLSYFDKMKEIE